MKTALKEWNCIVEALGKGQVTAIYRKGGISDKPNIRTNSTFNIEKEAFLLYPTFTHQDLDKIKKLYWEHLNQNHKLGIQNQLQIKYWAKVFEEIPIHNLEQLLSISNELVNSEEHLKSSFDLNPEHIGKVLILRVYSLKYSILLAESPEYGGCKSWIELNNIDIPRIKSKSVLSFKDFSKKLKSIKSSIEENAFNTRLPLVAS